MLLLYSLATLARSTIKAKASPELAQLLLALYLGLYYIFPPVGRQLHFWFALAPFLVIGYSSDCTYFYNYRKPVIVLHRERIISAEAFSNNGRPNLDNTRQT